MSLYLDANVLISAHTFDPLTASAESLLQSAVSGFVVSDFAKAECASIARRVRTGHLDEREARLAFERIDIWVLRHADFVGLTQADVEAAEAVLRELRHPLRTPDALHLVICRRIRVSLATFDVQLARAARTLGIDVHP